MRATQFDCLELSVMWRTHRGDETGKTYGYKAGSPAGKANWEIQWPFV